VFLESLDSVPAEQRKWNQVILRQRDERRSSARLLNARHREEVRRQRSDIAIRAENAVEASKDSVH
jgi:hypothetical protein